MKTVNVKEFSHFNKKPLNPIITMSETISQVLQWMQEWAIIIGLFILTHLNVSSASSLILLLIAVLKLNNEMLTRKKLKKN